MFWSEENWYGHLDNPIKNSNLHTSSVRFLALYFYLSPSNRPHNVPSQLEHKLHEGRIFVCFPINLNDENLVPEEQNSGPPFLVAKWAGAEACCCPLIQFLFHCFIIWVLLETIDKCCWRVGWICARERDLCVTQ